MFVLLIVGTVVTSILGLAGLGGIIISPMLFDASQPKDWEVKTVWGSMIALAVTAGLALWLAWSQWQGGANPTAVAWLILPWVPALLALVIVKRAARPPAPANESASAG